MSELAESTQMAADVIRETMAEEEAEEGGSPPWSRGVAVSTLVMALLAAITALLAGFAAHESLLQRTSEIIEVSYLEGDRVEVEVLKSKHEILTALGKQPDEAEVERIRQYEERIEELEIEAEQEESLVLEETSVHYIFAIGVTFFSFAITLSGMSIIVKRKWLWGIGLGVGAVGVLFVGAGIFI